METQGKSKVNKMIQINNYVTNYICNWWMKSAYIDKVVVKVCIDMHGHNISNIIVFL